LAQWRKQKLTIPKVIWGTIKLTKFGVIGGKLLKKAPKVKLLNCIRTQYVETD